MRRALVLALAVALTALALGWVGTGSARADGDPASDVLLQQDVFIPYSVPTSQGTANALLELTGRLRKAGWPIKVAIIASGDDLGSASQFATDPQGYADFLSSEISGGSRDARLLVVTTVGFGGENLGDNVDKALSGLSEDKADGDALGKLALTAVGRLAAADGHPVPVPAVDLSGTNARPYRSGVTLHGGQAATLNRGGGPRKPKGSGGGGSGGAAIGVAVGLTLVLLVAGAIAVRQRRKVSGP